VVPATRGLCVYTLSPPLIPGVLGRGAGGSCSGDVAQALQEGSGSSDSSPRGTLTVHVLPIAHPTITVGPRGHRETITPPYGIYVAFKPGPGCGPNCVVVGGAPGG